MKLWMQEIICEFIVRERLINALRYTGAAPAKDRNRDPRERSIRKQLAGPRHKWPNDIRMIVRAAYDLFGKASLRQFVPNGTRTEQIEIARKLFAEFWETRKQVHIEPCSANICGGSSPLPS